MQSDPVARVLLAFIAICMLLLLVQGAGTSGGTPFSSSSGEGRYEVTVHEEFEYDRGRIEAEVVLQTATPRRL